MRFCNHFFSTVTCLKTFFLRFFFSLVLTVIISLLSYFSRNNRQCYSHLFSPYMLRRGSRINTDRFPERAPKGDLGACSPRESVPGFLSHSDWILANSILLGLKALQIGGLVLLSISTWRVFLILKLIYCENSDRFLYNGGNR